ncbi:MAG: riboflavin biosynthesis protein RibF [Prevotella sp.]|jgi:riboflavin kinase/FMN adenylyltransferase|nr:riboflavin biosynthesis protein RibF [Prevotella sp.]
MVGFVATIGMFDGVHLGHQFVLQQTIDLARESGLQPLCITFDHSPRQEQVLTPLDEKVRLIRQMGIDRVEVLAFTAELKSLTARQFMEQVLRNQMNVRVLLTGYDNRFGRNREEGFDDYVRYGRELGIEVVSLPPAPSEGREGVVSSSYIRQLLLEGQVAEAAQCLGHPYSISGRVAHGEHIGTELGFPTANLVPSESQLIPAPGAYAVRVTFNTPHSSLHTQSGMMNIGTRPTFDGHEQTLEVHILHFHEDLYGQALSVEFVKRLREERRFDSMEALKEQLKQDAIQAEQAIKETSR